MQRIYILCFAFFSCYSLSAQWTALDFPEGVSFPDVEQMGDLVEHKGALFASSQGKRILKSTDQGETWEAPSGHSFYGVVDFIISTPELLIAAARSSFAEGYIWESSDEGATWTMDTVGMHQHLLYPESKAFVRDIKYFAGYLVVTFDNADAYYIKQVNAEGWVKSEYLAIHDPYAYAVHQENILIVAGGGSFHYTTDFGANWTQPMNAGLPAMFLGEQLASSGNRIYLAGESMLFYSDDLGESWNEVDISSFHGNDYLGLPQQFTALYADGSDLYLALNNDATETAPDAFLSTDNGLTFSSYNGGFPVDEFGTDAVHKFMKHEGDIFCINNFKDVYRQGGPSSIHAKAVHNIDLNIFPNPTTDIINIDDDSVGLTYSIYDNYGRLIFIGKEKTFHMTNFPGGQYIIKSSAAQVGRFIKQ